MFYVASKPEGKVVFCVAHFKRRFYDDSSLGPRHT